MTSSAVPRGATIDPTIDDAGLEVMEGLARLLREERPVRLPRDPEDRGGGLDLDRLRAAAAQGWWTPLADGRLTAAVTGAEQWGRALVPEPFVQSNVVVDTIGRAGAVELREAVLPRIVRGDAVVTWAAENLPGLWGSRPAPRLRESPAGITLSGEAALVQNADEAQYVLVAAEDDGGVTEVLLPLDRRGIRRSRLEGLDVTRTQACLQFDGVPIEPSDVVGTRGAAAAQLERQVQVAAVLSVAETIGAMSWVFDVALGHARTRMAFGRPIGSFQAVKHMLVDAGLALETSRAMCWAAAEAVDAGQPDGPEIASMTKAFVGRTGVDVAHVVWQTLGGIAYMWENDFHFYLRRITADAARYGGPGWHERRIYAQHSLA